MYDLMSDIYVYYNIKYCSADIDTTYYINSVHFIASTSR